MSQKKRYNLYNKLVGDYAHQKPAVDFCLGRDSAALFLEQRVGKTYITGAVIEQMVNEEQEAFYGLVVVPLSNKISSWHKMFKSELPHIHIQTELEKPPKDKPTVLIIHYEAASKIRKKLGRRKWSLAVWDESQRLKDRGSTQSRTAKMIKYAIKRIILSGTPMDGDPVDLWPQFRFCAPELFGTRWADFDSEYLSPTGYMGYKRKFKKHKLPEFKKKIKPYSMRITKDQVGIQKPKITRCPVDLQPRQQRLYNMIEKDMVGDWDGHDITSGLRITQNILLQQICNGFVRDDDDRLHWVGNAKLRKIKSLLRRVDTPVVIFCKYKREIRAVYRLCKKMGLATGQIKGGRKGKLQRPKTLKKFQAGKYDVLISHIKTGGVGVDLYAGRSIIFYSITYSYLDYEQAMSRLDAIGKEEPAKIYLVYARNTIDEDIYSIILSKKSVSDKVLNKLRRTRHGKNKVKRRK